MNRLLPLLSTAIVLAAAPIASAQQHPDDPDALAALRELVEAYRARPVLRVKVELEIQVEQDGTTSTAEKVPATITFAPKEQRGVVTMRGFTCWIGGGEIRAVHEATDHSYFSRADDGSPYYALLSTFQDLPFPHLAIAFGEPELDDLCMQLHPKAPYLRPTGVSEQKAEDGTVRQQITMSSDDATFEMQVDPKRRLIETATLKITGGMLVQPGATMVHRYRYTYETDVDDAQLAFDPERRQRTDALAALLPAPEPMQPGAGPGPIGRGALVGKPAPPLVLATADGAAVDLENLRDRVVVLDFWASWCAPCRAALPSLHEVAQWAKEQGLPVTVITVNVFEHAENPDDRLRIVREFWQQREFELPVAMDYTDEVGAAWGVQGIPATFVIRQGGVVHAQHAGAGPNYVEQLQAEIQEALAAAAELIDL